VRAIRSHARGGPEQLVYEDAPLPDPAAGEALLRVYAAGITPTELTWSETSPLKVATRLLGANNSMSLR
jgi:NADPH:quinone reductase-like Zn-dependent oxidoreductase